MLDTGSQMNFVPLCLCDPELVVQRDSFLKFKLANGAHDAVDRKTTFSFSLDALPTTTFSIPAYILDNQSYSVILALDFMVDNNVVVETASGKVTLNGVPVLYSTSPVNSPETSTSESLASGTSSLPRNPEPISPLVDKLPELPTLLPPVSQNRIQEDQHIDTSCRPSSRTSAENELEASYKKIRDHQDSRDALCDIKDFTASLPLKFDYTNCSRAFDVDPYDRDVFEREVNFLLDNDITEISSASVAAPAFLAKRSTVKKRMDIYYRELNKVLIPGPFPQTSADDIFLRLYEKEIFTVLDLKKGYYQVILEPSSRSLTAFVIPGGYYQFKRLPLG